MPICRKGHHVNSKMGKSLSWIWCDRGVSVSQQRRLSIHRASIWFQRLCLSPPVRLRGCSTYNCEITRAIWGCDETITTKRLRAKGKREPQPVHSSHHTRCTGANFDGWTLDPPCQHRKFFAFFDLLGSVPSYSLRHIKRFRNQLTSRKTWHSNVVSTKQHFHIQFSVAGKPSAAARWFCPAFWAITIPKLSLYSTNSLKTEFDYDRYREQKNEVVLNSQQRNASPNTPGRFSWDQQMR